MPEVSNIKLIKIGKQPVLSVEFYYNGTEFPESELLTKVLSSCFKTK